MSYDAEHPVDWSTYDRIATAAADMRFLLFEMRASREDLLRVMGPGNYERVREYLDCMDANLKKMGTIALSLATRLLAQTTDPTATPVLKRVRTLVPKGDINGAWNLVEAWACGREIPEEEEVP
jgi:hypothetical protein